MIAYLKGFPVKKTIDYIILNVNGVGYKVFIPLSTLCNIELNKEVSLLIETIIKDDAINLYGFLTDEERDIFLKLLSVSKVGPKLALTILSGLSVEKIVSSIQNKNIKLLSSVPGIGKKTAERICFDLKDKFQNIQSSDDSRFFEPDNLEEDLLNALINLGYKVSEIKDIARKVIDENRKEPIENLLKITLNILYNG